MSAAFVAPYRLRAEALEPRIRAVTGGLTPAQLAATPPQGGWSIAQVFEHLCRVAESYDPAIARALASARARTGAPREFRGTLFGTLLRKALMESNRTPMPAPRAWQPLAARERAVEEFVAHARRTADRLREAERLDVRGMLSSPMLGLLRMNLAEALAIEVVHAERHLGQAERARAAIATIAAIKR